MLATYGFGVVVWLAIILVAGRKDYGGWSLRTWGLNGLSCALWPLVVLFVIVSMAMLRFAPLGSKKQRAARDQAFKAAMT